MILYRAGWKCQKEFRRDPGRLKLGFINKQSFANLSWLRHIFFIRGRCDGGDEGDGGDQDGWLTNSGRAAARKFLAVSYKQARRELAGQESKGQRDGKVKTANTCESLSASRSQTNHIVVMEQTKILRKKIEVSNFNSFGRSYTK